LRVQDLKHTMPDLKPEEVTFFDDSQSKVDTALLAGIKAVRYTGMDSVRGTVD
jgi:FMN phosphatase YigB (HAD superfamily)